MKGPVIIVVGIEWENQKWSPRRESFVKIVDKWMNILGTRLAIGMGLMIGWSMGDGAPLSEDFPKKEIHHVTMGHKVRQLSPDLPTN